MKVSERIVRSKFFDEVSFILLMILVW